MYVTGACFAHGRAVSPAFERWRVPDSQVQRSSEHFLGTNLRIRKAVWQHFSPSASLTWANTQRLLGSRFRIRKFTAGNLSKLANPEGMGVRGFHGPEDRRIPTLPRALDGSHVMKCRRFARSASGRPDLTGERANRRHGLGRLLRPHLSDLGRCETVSFCDVDDSHVQTVMQA